MGCAALAWAGALEVCLGWRELVGDSTDLELDPFGRTRGSPSDS
jgi:hypothetical protein